VDEDASGLTFEEWDPSSDTDASEAPVAMIVNSSEMRFRPQRSGTTPTRGGGSWRTASRGATLKQIHGMGTRRYVLSVDNDDEFRVTM
jgi:hypothetical protein